MKKGGRWTIAIHTYTHTHTHTHTHTRTQVDGANKYIMEADFTMDIFLKMFDQILNNRAQDLDVVFSLM